MSVLDAVLVGVPEGEDLVLVFDPVLLTALTVLVLVGTPVLVVVGTVFVFVLTGP